MIYYKIEIDCEIFNVKRLSLSISLYQIIHKGGMVEIYKNPSSGKWSTLFRSNPDDTLSAAVIGPKIKLFYHINHSSKNSSENKAFHEN